MNFPYEILDGDTRGTMQALLPPSAKNMELLYGFTYEAPRSPGQTYRLQAGEHVTAPGDGKVTEVQRRPNEFRHTAGLLDTDATWKVTIHHGFNVYTTVQGMVTVTVQPGAPVVAGQDIGTPLTGEIFFQTLYRTTPYDPASISRFFRGYDGRKVPGKRGFVRQGVDILDRTDEEDVQSWNDGNIHYFVDKYCRREPVLLNIDFAGTGGKSGFAEVGNYGTDFWNVYTHSEFVATDGTNCIEILQGEHSSTGTATFYIGTLVECLHIGTTATAATFYTGTVVECLHIGTVSSSASFSLGTLVECLHIGTSSTAVTFYYGSLETDDPWAEAGTSYVSLYSGTSANLVVYLLGTNDPSFMSNDQGGYSLVSLYSGTHATMP